MKAIRNNKKANSRKESKKLRLEQLEKKVVPSSGKKPPNPPYAAGTLYGLAKRKNLTVI